MRQNLWILIVLAIFISIEVGCKKQNPPDEAKDQAEKNKEEKKQKEKQPGKQTVLQNQDEPDLVSKDPKKFVEALKAHYAELKKGGKYHHEPPFGNGKFPYSAPKGCPICKGEISNLPLPADGGYTEVSMEGYYCIKDAIYWLRRENGAARGTVFQWHGPFQVSGKKAVVVIKEASAREAEKEAEELLVKKDHSSLIALCSRAIQQYPNEYIFYFYRGIAYFQLRDVPNCQEDFQYFLAHSKDQRLKEQARELMKMLR